MLNPIMYSLHRIFGQYRRFSTQSKIDLQEKFTNSRIFNLLRLITDNRPTVIHHPILKRALQSHIKLLSDAELQSVNTFATAFTNQRLQMPPVLSQRDDPSIESVVISKDRQLQGILPSNYKLVFTDISDDLNQRNRSIVVREATGLLRHATASERNRINCVYFPPPGQRQRVPLMFSERYLHDMLERGQFLYILDRACNQFEPDDPQYIHITHTVYEYVNQLSWLPLKTSDEHNLESSKINPLTALRHTRHYGPLALYLITHLGSPGGLVYEAVGSQCYSRLGWLLRLIVLLRPDSTFGQLFNHSELPLPPPNEIDALCALTDQPDLELASDDVKHILSYAQLFVDKEPMSVEQKQLLQQAVQYCVENLELDRRPETVN